MYDDCIEYFGVRRWRVIKNLLISAFILYAMWHIHACIGVIRNIYFFQECDVVKHTFPGLNNVNYAYILLWFTQAVLYVFLILLVQLEPRDWSWFCFYIDALTFCSLLLAIITYTNISNTTPVIRLMNDKVIETEACELRLQDQLYYFYVSSQISLGLNSLYTFVRIYGGIIGLCSQEEH